MGTKSRKKRDSWDHCDCGKIPDPRMGSSFYITVSRRIFLVITHNPRKSLIRHQVCDIRNVQWLHGVLHILSIHVVDLTYITVSVVEKECFYYDFNLSNSDTALWSTTSVRMETSCQNILYWNSCTDLLKRNYILAIPDNSLTYIYTMKVYKTWRALISGKRSLNNDVVRRSPQPKASSWMKCVLVMLLEFLLRTFPWSIPIRNTDISQNNWKSDTNILSKA